MTGPTTGKQWAGLAIIAVMFGVLFWQLPALSVFVLGLLALSYGRTLMRVDAMEKRLAEMEQERSEVNRFLSGTTHARVPRA